MGIGTAIAGLLATGALAFSPAPPTAEAARPTMCGGWEDLMELALANNQYGLYWDYFYRFSVHGCW